MSDYSAVAIRAAVGRGAIGQMILIAEAVASSNDVAAELARRDAPHGSVVVARVQTAGRGRRGSSWWHDPDTGLAMSVLLRPELEASRAPELVHVAALALDTALTRFGAASRIKWPNDIVVGELPAARKLAGLLVESAVRGDQLERVVVGIGVNVNTEPEDFDPERAPAATSLLAEVGQRIERNAVVAAICQALEHWLARHRVEGMAGLLPELRRRSASLGAELRTRVEGAEITGRAVDLDAGGALVLETADGQRHRLLAPPD